MVHTIAGIDIALWDSRRQAVEHAGLSAARRADARQDSRLPHPAGEEDPARRPYEHSLTPADVEVSSPASRPLASRSGRAARSCSIAPCAIPPARLIQLAMALKPYDLLFLEEPAVPGNIEVFKRLKEKISIPLAAGERDRTIWEFLPYLQHRCLDILQPDCCHGGGITAMRKVRDSGRSVADAARAALHRGLPGHRREPAHRLRDPLFLIHEFYPDNAGFNKAGITRMEYKLDKDGYIGLPPGPGLGVEVDEKKLEEEAKKPQTYKWPGANLKDGSISDY